MRTKKAAGFTLVELVVVIVLLGVTAVTMTFLITGSVGGYIDTARRLDSASSARIALDRMGRELREAMPMSIRINNGCLQFLPTLSSTVYTTFPIATTSISVLDFAVPAAPTMYAVIYPTNSNQLYTLTAMKQISGISAATANQRTITLGASSTYPRQSPAERLYVVGDPISYCLQGALLYRYTSGVTAAQPLPAAMNGQALLIDNLDAANSSFDFQTGNFSANGLVKIILTISRASIGGANENLQLDHEVWIRNVQ